MTYAALFIYRLIRWNLFPMNLIPIFNALLKGGNHGSAHVSVMSRAYCFLTNQWRVDFRGKFAFVNKGYAVGLLCSVVSTSSLLIVRFHSFGIEMSSEDTGTESCKCNGVCSRKDGSQAKGCPCKMRGVFCIKRCKCLVTSKNCQNQVGFLLFFSLTSYFSCFRCIPNNSNQMNDYSNALLAISLNRTDINDFLSVEGYCFDSVIFKYSPHYDLFCFIS